MSEFKGLIVTFDKDYSDEDVEFIVNAIKMIKGVCDVSLSDVTTDDIINRMKIHNDIKAKLINFMKKELNNNI